MSYNVVEINGQCRPRHRRVGRDRPGSTGLPRPRARSTGGVVQWRQGRTTIPGQPDIKASAGSINNAGWTAGYQLTDRRRQRRRSRQRVDVVADWRQATTLRGPEGAAAEDAASAINKQCEHRVRRGVAQTHGGTEDGASGRSRARPRCWRTSTLPVGGTAAGTYAYAINDGGESCGYTLSRIGSTATPVVPVERHRDRLAGCLARLRQRPSPRHRHRLGRASDMSLGAPALTYRTPRYGNPSGA